MKFLPKYKSLYINDKENIEEEENEEEDNINIGQEEKKIIKIAIIYINKHSE
jgi:hypothetical protein